MGVADLAVAAPFANLRWAAVGAELSRWPRTAAWVARVEGCAPLDRLTALGERFLTTPRAERAALFGQFGVALAGDSVAGREARRGPMTTV